MSTTSIRWLALCAAALTWLAMPALAQNLESKAERDWFFAGTLLEGDYRSTWESDSIHETFQEAETGGKPSNRTSELEHLWDFTLPPGLAHTLHVRAELTDSGEGDDLELWWSEDDIDYWPLLVLTPADSGTVVSVALPPDLSGPFFLWMQDGDRSGGNRALDEFAIDWLCVETVPDDASVTPVPPADAKADGKSASTIAVGWRDDTALEDGFRIERSGAGANAWVVAGTVAADTTVFIDESLPPFTSYDYRVIAFNAVGDSDPSNVATATARAVGSFASEPISREFTIVDDAWRDSSHGMDSSGRAGVVAIAFATEIGLVTPAHLYFFERDPGSGAWSSHFVADDAFEDDGTVFEYGPDDVPRVAYRNPGYELRLAERVGSAWQVSTIDTPTVGQSPALAHDPAGRPAVAYVKHARRQYKDAGLWLIRRDGSGGTWSVPEQVDPDPGARHPSLRCTATGSAAIAYRALDFSTSIEEVRYAVESDAGWTMEVVYSGPFLTGRPFLSLAPGTDMPTIVYLADDQLWLTRGTASGWVAELVSGDVYGGVRIVHDGMGQELVTYNKGDIVAQAWIGSVLATCSPGNVREELVDPLGFSEAPSVHWSAVGGVSLCYRGLLFAGDDWFTDGWMMFAQR